MLGHSWSLLVTRTHSRLVRPNLVARSPWLATFRAVVVRCTCGVAADGWRDHAKTSCHPLDVVRKRLQLQGLSGRPHLYRNMIDGIFGIARAEGVSGLYKVTAARPPCTPCTTVKSGCRKHEFDSSFVSFVAPSLSFALRSTPSSSSS